MRRSTLNFVIDAVSLLVMLAMISTGLLIRYVLPPGSRGGGGLSLWGWTRHDWGDLHFWLALALGGLLLLHVALHWTWVCALIRGHAPLMSNWKRNLYGGAFVALTAALVGGFIWIASANALNAGAADDHRQLRAGRGSQMDGAAGLGREDAADDRPRRGRGPGGGGGPGRGG